MTTSSEGHNERRRAGLRDAAMTAMLPLEGDACLARARTLRGFRVGRTLDKEALCRSHVS